VAYAPHIDLCFAARFCRGEVRFSPLDMNCGKFRT
jgi:hypothetical protein